MHQNTEDGHSSPAPDLEGIAAHLESEIMKFEGLDSQKVSEKGYLTWSVHSISLKLTKMLQNDEAILLPELHEEFCQFMSSTIDNFP